jgi:spermidine synthase
MVKVLGPGLGVEATWAASDAPAPEGELASIFAATDNIHKWLHYLPVYESALSPFRPRPIRMLEIGVARGGSLQMWRRYLHPESVIVGIDIDLAARRFDDPCGRQHVRIGDQQDVRFLTEVVSEFGLFDVIVDDGSHMNSHMVNTFRHLFPNALAPGGVYIVEDIHCSYWKRYRDDAMSFVDFTKWLIDAMHAHYQLTHSELQFRVGDWHRLPEVRVPVATTLVEKVEFYDSIALVHRAHGRRELPRSIYQVDGAAHTT